MSIYQTPQSEFTPEELAQSKAPQIYTSIAIVTVIATVGVVLRFISRRKSKTALSYDDYTIALALVFLYGLNTVTVLNTALYGLGRHLPAVNPALIPSFQKAGLANFVLYFTTSAIIKASLLLLYYRYFGISRTFRIALYVAAGVIVCWYLGVIFATIFQCVPVAAFWNRNIKNSKCMNLLHFSTTSGVTNLLTDVIILCLPMPMVWTLHTNKTQKITLTGIFLLGFFVCAASIVRIVEIYRITSFDVTWEISQALIWTSIEPAIGILSACLPTMRKPNLLKETVLPSDRKDTNNSYPIGPLFGRFLRLPSKTAITTKSGSSSAKKPVLATKSTITPVSRNHDWGFNKLDEEAAVADHLHTSPGVSTKVWGDKPESIETEYEMEIFENKPLPERPQKGKGSGPRRW